MNEAAARGADHPAVWQRWLGWLQRHPRLILTVFCLALWAPGVFLLPPTDRDESRFAQSSKQMLESREFVDIRFGAVPRYKKPVGIYWMQAATTAIADLGRPVHDRIWTYRLPSLFGALAAVWLTFWCARAFAAVEAAFLAAALMGATLLLTGEAIIATTDAVLAACVLGAQGFFLRVYRAACEGQPPPHFNMALIGWAALGLGVLVKGPVAVAVCALTLIGLSLWDRDWRWLKESHPLAGLGVVLLIVAPWAVAIALRSHGGFYEQSLGHDFAAKVAGGQESHGAPPGYFLAFLSMTLWPVTLFLIPALVAAWRQRGEPAIRFLVAWIVPAWLMFELVPTKLPHYILPLYPALAILAALWALGPKETAARLDRWLFWAAPVQFALGVLALAAAILAVPAIYGDGVVWWQLVCAVLFVAFGVIAVIAYARKFALTAAAAALVSALIVYPLMTAGVAPSLQKIWISPRAAAAAKALARPDDPPPALAGYLEPSMVFLSGTETRLTDGRGAAEAGATQGGLAFVEERQRPAFMAHLAELEADTEQVGEVDGLNYSSNAETHIHIYRVTPVRDWAPPPPEE
jgi:4-amino-4-deoxy-L-arabinose transferase-like glycosyltransferase